MEACVLSYVADQAANHAGQSKRHQNLATQSGHSPVHFLCCQAPEVMYEKLGFFGA